MDESMKRAHVGAAESYLPDDPVAVWRRGVREREALHAEARAKRAAVDQAQADNSRQWQEWVRAEIRIERDALCYGVGERLTELIEGAREQLKERDKRIDALELQLVRLQADHAKLELRVIKGEVQVIEPVSSVSPAIPRRAVN
jgi:hypothetical protein